jgi:hypothetical protein
MRKEGPVGVSRGRKLFTTQPDADAWRPSDLVKPVLHGGRPDALWVTNLTYVPTPSGMAYVCFNWVNHDRLHSHCGDIPRAEREVGVLRYPKDRPPSDWTL